MNIQDTINKARAKLAESPVSRKDEAWTSPVQIPYVGDTIQKAREVIRSHYSPYKHEAWMTPVSFVKHNKDMIE